MLIRKAHDEPVEPLYEESPLKPEPDEPVGFCPRLTERTGACGLFGAEFVTPVHPPVLLSRLLYWVHSRGHPTIGAKAYYTVLLSVQKSPVICIRPYVSSNSRPKCLITHSGYTVQ